MEMRQFPVTNVNFNSYSNVNPETSNNVHLFRGINLYYPSQLLTCFVFTI